MSKLGAGFMSGFIATIVLSVFMIAKAMAGMMPAFNAIRDNAHLVSMITSLPAAPPIGWITHFVIGTILWGAAYAWLRPKFSASGVVAGMTFGIIAWLAMMIVFMPIVGHGLFALGIGFPATVATLVLHLIYGAALGLSYDWFTAKAAAA